MSDIEKIREQRNFYKQVLIEVAQKLRGTNHQKFIESKLRAAGRKAREK